MSEALRHPWSIVRTIHPQRSTETTEREDTHTQTRMKAVSTFRSPSLAYTRTYFHFKSSFQTVSTHTHTDSHIIAQYKVARIFSVSFLLAWYAFQLCYCFRLIRVHFT